MPLEEKKHKTKTKLTAMYSKITVWSDNRQRQMDLDLHKMTQTLIFLSICW